MTVRAGIRTVGTGEGATPDVAEREDLLVEIRPEDPRPIYVQIMDEVRRAVALGDLGADDPLPSVRELAADLRVNPNTVSQAYRELDAEGTVYVRRGRGTFVAPDAVPAEQREALARGVAERALRDAHRHGLSADELVRAVRAAADRGDGHAGDGGRPAAGGGDGKTGDERDRTTEATETEANR